MSSEEFKQYLISELTNFVEELDWTDPRNISEDSYVTTRSVPISDNRFEQEIEIMISYIEETDE